MKIFVILTILGFFVGAIKINNNTRINECQMNILNAQDEVMKAQSNVILHLLERIDKIDKPTTQPKEEEEELELVIRYEQTKQTK